MVKQRKHRHVKKKRFWGSRIQFPTLGGGNSNIFDVHPYLHGAMIQFDEEISQFGLVKSTNVGVVCYGMCFFPKMNPR